MTRFLMSVVVLACSCAPLAAQERLAPIKVLFLGDNGGHRPVERFRQLQPIMEKRGIDLVYTDKVDALKPAVLGSYDALIIYANTVRIAPEQEKALLDFVENGKGFVPIHCASYCFLNSPKYISLVGAQFQKHGTGTFRTTPAAPNHPLMKGYQGFESWDETYVHAKHNDEGRTILEYRVEGKSREPWTWVRTQGLGRVFYTAWGHDQRTWGNPGFHDLIERGIRWATGRNAEVTAPSVRDTVSHWERPFPVPVMTAKREDVKPFEYADVGKSIPNYRAGKKGEHLSQMPLPLPAEESLKHMVVPKGFRVELFAADPEIRRPLCMNWDARGRLWIAESIDYPNELGKQNDRIVICEDTDGDGRADKFTVFADKLSIPTGILFAQGGVLVFEGGRTLFLKDTDGDDKADVRQVLFGNWSMRDTHGCVSNMHYGLDNWIWAMQGYNFSRVQVGNETHEFRQGFFRFRPDASRLEFLRSTNNNTWGLGFSEEGLVFGSTANGNPSVHMAIPNRYYEAVRGWAPSLVLRTIADSFRFKPITDKVRQVDFHGGYTAAAGHALYTARNYPREYWNRTAFVCEPTGHLVGTFVLRGDGSQFRSSNPFNLLASDDEWTSPIMAEVGPDGNIWVIDWYNYIVQHNPTPIGFKTGKGAAYETQLRDKKHGRIYRIVPEGAQPEPAITLAAAAPAQLVATLKHPNMFWRRHAQRLLVERGKTDVVPALIELAGDGGVDEIGLNAGVIHALWTLHGLGAMSGADDQATRAAEAALSHRSAGVRRNAALVLPPTPRSVRALLEKGMLRDGDPHVRLASLLALADLPPSPAAGPALVDLLQRADNTTDRGIADATVSAAARHDVYFLETLARAKNPAPSERALEVLAIVAEHFARGGQAGALDSLLRAYAGADAKVVETFLGSLARGWPRASPVTLTPDTEKSLETLLPRLSTAGQGKLIRLATDWKSKGFEQFAIDISRNLLGVLANDKETDDARAKAARQLVELQPGDSALVTRLLSMLSPRASPKLATGLIDALGASSAPAAAQTLVKHLAGLTPSVRAAALALLLRRADSTDLVLDAVGKGQVQLGELTLDQKQALLDHPRASIAARARKLLAKGAGLPNPDRQKVIDDLLPLTTRKGDAALGKPVFAKHCANCHTHNGEGAKIGPDLTGTAVHPKAELLVHIFDPSRSVEGNFRLYTVTTQDGFVLSGMLASESKTSLELIDAQAKKHLLLRDNIDQVLASNKSLMPDGFEKLLSADETVNLLEFLTQRGKYLPLPLDKVATAVSSRGMFYGPEAKTERLVFSEWTPKTFEGVPFHLVDPQGERAPNVILLYGPQGTIPPKMPRTVTLPCNSPAKAIHMLSGVSGWGYPYSEKGSVSMIVRLHYDDGSTEDHPLKNGEHFADYIRRVDVPGSKFAFDLRGKQIRYLAVHPQRDNRIERIELVKGSDATAPVVMAVTVESR